MGNDGVGDSKNATGSGDAKSDNIYENRPGSKKIIRVVTVIAYLVSVSFVAIVLSAYYVFLWHPPNPRLMHRSHLIADPQIDYLMDKPPMEIIENETLTSAEIRDKVNVFRQEILRSRGVNISFRSQHQEPQRLEKNVTNSKSSYVDNIILTNGTGRNNSQTAGSLWNSIVRTSLATTSTPTTQITLGNSTNVYESFNVAIKSSTGMGRLRASTVFMETREINGSSSTTRVSSSSLSKSKNKLYNASVNDFALTTATAFTTGNTRNSEENQSSSYPSKKFRSVTELSIKGIIPTRAHELVGNLGNRKGGLDRVGRSGTDQHIAGTTLGTSGITRKTTLGNVNPFGRSTPAQIWQHLDRTATPSGHRRDDKSEAFGSTKHPNIIGSRITRVPTKSPTNDTEPLEKYGTIPPEKQDSIEVVPDPPRDVEQVLNSPASIVPILVQPGFESIENEQESKEQLTQDGDFAFI